MRTVLVSVCLFLGLASAYAQRLPDADSVKSLLTDISIQIECTEGVNKMYNYEFAYAESQFKWFKRNYPKHPLPYFLLGLSQWWKIMPDIEGIKAYDKAFFVYMDSSILFAEKMYKKDPKNAEATFFLSAAYAFKGRLNAERSNWTKATYNCKKALDFLEMNREQNGLSPEFLFGDGLYNYYSVWLRENYKALRPVLMFFEKGDKQLGIKQLEEVASDAFYTKTEAQMYLMRIYEIDEDRTDKAFPISEYLHQTFPNNPYFHRFYARMLYIKGDFRKLKDVSEQILQRVDDNVFGYEATSGRYAAFYLANYYKSVGRDKDKSKEMYRKTVDYAEEKKAYESGYYIYSLGQLARLAKSDKDYPTAKGYYEKLLDHTDRKNGLNKEAKTFLKNLRKGKYK